MHAVQPHCLVHIQSHQVDLNLLFAYNKRGYASPNPDGVVEILKCRQDHGTRAIVDTKGEETAPAPGSPALSLLQTAQIPQKHKQLISIPYLGAYSVCIESVLRSLSVLKGQGGLSEPLLRSDASMRTKKHVESLFPSACCSCREEILM